MQQQSKIIIGNCPSVDVYYRADGMYLKNKLESGTVYMANKLEGFKYIQVGDNLKKECSEMIRFSDSCLRIKNSLGKGQKEETIHKRKSDKRASILVIYDAPDADVDLFIKMVKQVAVKNTKVVYIMQRTTITDRLLKYLIDNHLEQLTVIVNATILRRRGFDIAKGLSWETTISDLIWQVYADHDLCIVAQKEKLIVRFESEGALWFGNKENNNSLTFEFMADVIEGDKIREDLGIMYDFDVHFTMPIVTAVVNNTALDEAINKGLQKANAFYDRGYIVTNNGIAFSNDYHKELNFNSISLTLDKMNQRPGHVWSVLEDDQNSSLEKLSKEVVLHGMKCLDNIPSARFGFLVTVDRNEIERYRTIRNLMEEYLNTKNVSRPLSIAVFGTPGSGKSFGMTQIAKCLGKGRIEKIEFNLSQMRSEDELLNAFHRIQDIVLGGKIPLVFFDEFDSSKHREELGWMKSFLAPMQDGEFNHNGIHPLGKCIFIFAGGIFETFDDFRKNQDNKNAKVRDFISRLRGYVNIQGPNPRPTPEEDPSFILRRAVLLRSLIERKAKEIMSKNGDLRIDEDIINAMLRIPQYQHGVRSMEAIIDMSMLAGKDYWSKADLPPVDQLAIHIGDQNQFQHLLLVNKLFASYREEIACQIHNNYLQFLEKDRNGDLNNNPNNCSWEELSEDFREDNRNQADDYIKKLFSINCSIEPKSMGTHSFEFTEEEIEYLARKEHHRWMISKLKNGWKYGKETNKAMKINVCICPWEELDEYNKDKDRSPIKNMIQILEKANLSIYRIN